MDKEKIRSRIAACLYGGALGDALGYTVEFIRWSDIQREYGPQGISDLVPRAGRARFSDDTQMTLFTAEGMCLGYFAAKESGNDLGIPYYIYQAYRCWLRTQGYSSTSMFDDSSRLVSCPGLNSRRAPGNTCLSSLASGRMGTIEHPINGSKGCGGVMRTAPLGFIRGGDESRSPLLLGAKAAAITHGHPLGFIPAGMLSDIVARCIYGEYKSLADIVETSLEATVKQFVDCGRIALFEALICRAIDLALADGERDIASIDEPAIRSLGEGWVGDEALAIAIDAALRYPGDIKASLRAAVNHSGDSDSTGAIAGNILGAYLGMDAVPGDWTAQLELTEEIEYIIDFVMRIIES